ncbi:META domain-containing protein [Psychroflexus sp. ALD_RP9]|uniref:META domain-containing protein n=1 Tax=Psychroflexus sp. ALD_RP9 TaxID=2777186 RepID=UPI001A8E521B|nr:META domain-containing protein [Psychroflexus sp. ALD_RP9]QSS97973.1 META domain-containing protein [Psychroflexus sp. ALD_RP9]
MKYLKFLGLLIAFMLVACKAQQIKTTGLSSGEYKIIYIDNNDVSKHNLTLNIEAEKKIISGYSGCNNYRFNYEESEEQLDLGYGVSSKMYCQDTQAIEDSFFEASSQVKAFKQTKTSLELLNNKGQVEVKAVKTN